MDRAGFLDRDSSRLARITVAIRNAALHSRERENFAGQNLPIRRRNVLTIAPIPLK
jgi:hypothetical protein